MDKAGLDELLERVRRHDPEALAALVDAYSPRVYGLLFQLTGSRDLTDDLLQETFLRVVQTMPTYEHTGRFEPWLFRIAANLARDAARRVRRRGPQSSFDERAGNSRLRDAGGRGATDGSDPQARLLQQESEQRLVECLQGLSDADREIILLRHYSELSFREIADLLGVPLGTALARAHRALARLRAELGEEEEP